MIYERFFLVLAGMVLAALLGGWMASGIRSIPLRLAACAGVSALLAMGILWLASLIDTEGFAGLLVLAAFLFSLVIAFSGSLVFHRLRQARQRVKDNQTHPAS